MSLPKTQYQVGEKLDLTGGTAELLHDVGNDSNAVIKPLTEFHVNTSEFDSTQPGIYNIYVTAKEGSLTATDVFTVTVEDKSEAETIIDEPTTVPPTTDPTEFSQFEGFFFHAPAKKFYKLGDAIDMTGAYVSWDDGTKIPITDPRFTVDASGYKNSSPGVYSIYVTFTDGRFQQTEDFLAVVLNADGTPPDGWPTPTGSDNPYDPTSGIDMTTEPADPSEFSRFEGFFFHAPKKRWYKIGDDLDLTGTYVSLGDGEKIPVTDPRITVDASSYENTKPGAYTIYVTFTDGSFKRTEDFSAMVLKADGTAPAGYPTPTGSDNPYDPTSGIAMTTAPAIDDIIYNRLGDVDANGETNVMDNLIVIEEVTYGNSQQFEVFDLTEDTYTSYTAHINCYSPEEHTEELYRWVICIEVGKFITTRQAVNAAVYNYESETGDPEPDTYYIDPTAHWKESPSEEYEETTILPSGAWDTQPAQISEHFYGADVWKEPASGGEDSPWISVETRPSGSSMGIYAHEFYKTNNLIYIDLTEPSGSYELTVDDVVVDADGNYVVKITRKIPQTANGSLVRWHLLVNIDKGCTDPKKVKLDITEKHI